MSRLLGKAERESPKQGRYPETGWLGWEALDFCVCDPLTCLLSLRSVEPTFQGLQRETYLGFFAESQVLAETPLLQRNASPPLRAGTAPQLRPVKTGVKHAASEAGGRAHSPETWASLRLARGRSRDGDLMGWARASARDCLEWGS